jgi:putative ABC transport system permease protein
MRSILLVALSNIRRRKKQNFLVGLSIFFSVLLLATAAGILGGIRKPFDNMFDKLKGSHILLFYDRSHEDADTVSSWFRKQPEVDNISDPEDYYLITEPSAFRSREIKLMFYVTEYSRKNHAYDSLLMISGSNQQVPGPGEVWIPRHLAVRYGITEGDTIKLPLAKGFYPMKVSAVIIDPEYVSGIINPNRIWVAPGMLSFMVQIGDIRNAVQGVRLKNRNDTEELLTRFRKECNFNGTKLQYSLFKSVFTSIFQIIGAIIAVFSILATVIACYIVTSVIRSSVMSDSRIIGTLQALGFSPRMVTKVFLFQYSIISIAAIPAGIIASFFAIRIILQSVTSAVGLSNFDFPFSIVFIAVSVLFILLIYSLVITSCSGVTSLQPSRALRSVAEDSVILRKQRRFPFNIKSYPLTVWLALKLIFDNPGRSVLTFLNLTIAAYITVFSMNALNSFKKIQDYKSMWGLDNADIQLFRPVSGILPVEHKALLRSLKEIADIREVVPFSYYDLTIQTEDEKRSEEISGKVYERAPSVTGLANVEGRDPEGEKDISLCIGTARAFGKKPGDSIRVRIENERKMFAVSGVYQDISNMGKGFRLSINAVKALNPLFEPDRYSLMLTTGEKTVETKNEILAKLGESVRIELTADDQLASSGITGSLISSIVLITLFFMCLVVTSLFNDIYMSVWENRKTIGILSLTGFTDEQLKTVMVFKSVIFTGAGVLAGIPLALFTEPFLMSSITAGMGIVQFPLAVSPAGMLVSVLVLILVTTLSSWRASVAVKKIKSLLLVNE